jgi:hypothetical protein
MKYVFSALALVILAAAPAAHAVAIFDFQPGLDASAGDPAQFRVGGQHGDDAQELLDQAGGGLQIGYSSGGVFRDANWTLDDHPRPHFDWGDPRVPSPAPEPAEWVMLLVGGGLVGLLLHGRRRAAG